MSNKHELNFKVLAPLSNFNWNGDNFSIDNLCTIQRLDTVPDLSWCEASLSKFDKDELNGISHWLSFEQLPSDKLKPSEKINVFLLALWVALPTRTQVKFRFELPHKSGRGQLSTACRLLDRFQWIETQAKDKIETKHLEEMIGHVNALVAIYAARKRLWNSARLTFNGCTTISWQVAFISFSAAAEGILTYSTAFRITHRLAKSFACLTRATKGQRDSAYRAFTHSYSIRSDIMHGRAMKLGPPTRNLKELAKFSDLLRELWKNILSSKAIITELEKDDANREIWFTGQERGYKPPKT